MLRGGHALQVANRALLSAHLKSSSRGGASTPDPAHVKTLQTLKMVEERAVERIESAVAERGVRFRPSLLLPALQCSSAVIGSMLSLFSANVSDAYQTGVKTAISDYYNDQIREIYEKQPEEVALKELFKTTRDEELAFVDANSLDGMSPDPAAAEHPAAMFAKTSSKLLVQVVKTL
ncbi:hypothetical protein PybrP1_002161 [[Pythium] brassicae (nom. inval.)]|nr:hypothetical protein PybrP1_002161 [[Pythium] brassicae (nom. inval.)]